MITQRFSLATALSATLVLSGGCENSSKAPPPVASAADDHDHEHGDSHEGHEHHLDTLAQALAELTELRDTARDAFAKNDPETAHGPLHEVGHVLEAIPKLAEKEGVSGEPLGNVKAAVNSLFEAFGAVDKSMHSNEGSKYSDVSVKIDEAIKALTDAAPTAAASAHASEIPPGADPGSRTPPKE